MEFRITIEYSITFRLHFDNILCPSFSQIIKLTLTFRSKLWYFARDVNSLLIFQPNQLIFQPKCQPFSTYKLQDKNTQFLSNNNAQFLSSDCLILSIVNEIWTYCSFINSTVCSFMDFFLPYIRIQSTLFYRLKRMVNRQFIGCCRHITNCRLYRLDAWLRSSIFPEWPFLHQTYRFRDAVCHY